MKRPAAIILLALGLGFGLRPEVAYLDAPGLLPWEDATEADWIYPLATRFATIDGHTVHYPTPTAELASSLESRAEVPALRHLAEAKLALGDREGAKSALLKWAEASGPEGWAEAARWGAAHLDWAFAFSAAQRAIPGLPEGEKRVLVDARLGWAIAHPDVADPMAFRKERAELFPQDSSALEDYLRALERSGALDAAQAALTSTRALAPERALLLRSDLLSDHGQHRAAFDLLDAACDQGFSLPGRTAYAVRTDEGNPTAPETWRSALERAFDRKAVVRLVTYFEGKGRGDAAADLLRQVERRHEARLGRDDWQVLARLWADVGAIPEAFRAQLAAAQKGTAVEQADDLAPLGHLALKAGGLPLPWGTFNDEPYRWVARMDRTPGFWTGGLSFLLTGQPWRSAYERLETESLPDRTFAVALALEAELARRSPQHKELPSLRLSLMSRHVERGEGKEALALLPGLETGPREVAQEARRVALLALRQVQRPIAEELRLYQERLKALAEDTSSVAMTSPQESSETDDSPRRGEPWRRVPRPERGESYHDVLNQAIARLEERDPSHRTAVQLLLGEMDRLPNAEGLWEELADHLERWNLDDDLGPRYEQALRRFPGAGIWDRAARFYARRARQTELRQLALDLTSRFRGAAIFERASADVKLEIPDQPRRDGRVRLAPWGDWVRLKALERFPHSPLVFEAALGRLVRKEDPNQPQSSVLVTDSLLETRRWALLFVDKRRREEYFAGAMREGVLEATLSRLESQKDRTPVEDLLLFEGWSRLSRFEQAWPAADRLGAAYPGDAALAGRVLSLHRSLTALDPSHAIQARVTVERTAPAVIEPGRLWTELGELEEERGRPDAALATWQHLLASDTRNPERLLELATLLWDYGHMKEALAVVEDGRKAMSRPRFMAFEAGVLREEVKDIDGAITEYLTSLDPEDGDCFCSWFDHDQRSLRRLSQLLRHERVRNRVEERIASLKPGVRVDEQVLASFFPMGTIELPDRVAGWNVDDWIDFLDMPNDPVGRKQRALQEEDARNAERSAITHVGHALFTKTLSMVGVATEVAFLDATDSYFSTLPQAERAAQEVSYRNAVMTRRAVLAPTEEARVALEVERARYLLGHGRRDESDAVWSALVDRIGRLPEGSARMQAETDRAAYLERSKGTDAAAAEWGRLGGRYAWSLGILEARLAFLSRVGRGDDERRVLEEVVPRAASGHREALLDRLARESLDAHDLPRARRAVEGLLGGALDDDHRLGADHLFLRLSLREAPGFDALALAKTEAPKLKPEREADLYAELARAAEAESSWTTGMQLWIEALNRRTDRSWIGSACRTADKAQKGDAILDFFERQRVRSPRDVRWAVMVREIRLHRHDLEGAIEMAKVAVSVKPDRQGLWQEAVDLLVRAGRVREAADYLEDWQKARPADEDTMHWRGALYGRLGDGDKVLALERATYAAFVRQSEADPDHDEPRKDRKVRAVQRFRELGFPQQALRFLAPDGDIRGIAKSPLAASDQATLALATDHFIALLRSQADDISYPVAAAQALRQGGTSEQKAAVAAFLMSQLAPVTPGAAPFVGNPKALEAWWPFATTAGLEPQLRVLLARQYLMGAPGPWQSAPSTAFEENVGASLVVERDSKPTFEKPDVDALWFRDLVRRDAVQEAAAFLEPRIVDLLARIRSPKPTILAAAEQETRPLLEWGSWLDPPEAFDLFVRSLSSRPERLADFSGILSERRQWDRLWVLAARHWRVGPLVAILPESARTAWIGTWQVPSTRDNDPVLRARAQSLEDVGLALGHLVSGAPGSAKDPRIVKLRGPLTVGGVLGTDPSWVYPEFEPRSTPGVAESGADSVIGRGVDRGRLPGAFWGERPGDAWFVLETLARLREKDALAPLVPLEIGHRGQEGVRTLAAVRLASALGDAPLAYAIDEASPPQDADLGRLGLRIRMARAAGEKDRATAILKAEVRRLQASMNGTTFRSLRRLAEDEGCEDPLGLLDPATPVAPGLLAFLYDRVGPDAASHLAPKDRVEFLLALQNRWSTGEVVLDASRTRFALDALWAQGMGALPRSGLPSLGGIWPQAADWLETQVLENRPEALAALKALPDDARLAALISREEKDKEEVTRLLRLRVKLLRGDLEGASAMARDMLPELQKADSLSLDSRVIPSQEVPTDDEGVPTASPNPSYTPEPATDPVAARLANWLAAFKEAKHAELVQEPFEKALRSLRDEGPVPLSSWALALDLTAPEGRPALLQELENAWIRGDWAPNELGPLVLMIARKASEETPRWLARWAPSVEYSAVAARARVLWETKDGPGVTRVLVDGRRRGGWSAADETRAFDVFRLHGQTTPASVTAPIPQGWTTALPFWKQKAETVGPELGRHLRAQPFDLLSARAALRTVAPLDAESARLAALSLEDPTMDEIGDPSGDAAFLRLRAARSLRASSSRAARSELGSTGTNVLQDLRKRHMGLGQTRATLADVARLTPDTGTLEGMLSALEDQDPALARSVRAELRARPKDAPQPFRLANGWPAPYRPRDLDWSLVAAVLDAGGIR